MNWRIKEFDELPSTQDLLRERLQAGIDVHGLVLRAAVQTAGRGRRARDWASSRGGSWQTAAVSLDGESVHPASALFVGIGIISVIAGNPGVATRIAAGADGSVQGATRVAADVPGPPPRLALKWPNDLLWDGLKAGGILCEAVRGHLLVGVGLNVANAVPAGAARLDFLALDEAQGLVLDGIARGIELMRGDPAELPRAFATWDALAGRRLRVEQGGRVLEGTGAGVDAHGRLQLLADRGTTLAVDSGVPYVWG